MSEINTLKQIMLEHNQYGRIWRNNQGIATYGKIKVRYGVARGGSDLIGFTMIQARPIFTAIEVKDIDWKFNPKREHDVQQHNFLNLVVCSGGVAGFARSVEEYNEIIKKYLAKNNTAW